MICIGTYSENFHIRVDQANNIGELCIKNQLIRLRTLGEELIDRAWFNVPANSPTQFYRSKDPTNSIKILKEKATKENPEKNKTTENNIHTK